MATKEQLLMTEEDILNTTLEDQSLEEQPTLDDPLEDESVVEAQLAQAENSPKAELPTPADHDQQAVSPLDLIKIRKKQSGIYSVSDVISARKSGKPVMSVTDIIASRKSGHTAGVTAKDIISERKFSPRKQFKVIS